MEDNIEQIAKNLADQNLKSCLEQSNASHFAHNGVCPHCGYCPTCGRPYHGWNQPWYGPNVVYCGAGQTAPQTYTAAPNTMNVQGRNTLC